MLRKYVDPAHGFEEISVRDCRFKDDRMIVHDRETFDVFRRTVDECLGTFQFRQAGCIHEKARAFRLGLHGKLVAPLDMPGRKRRSVMELHAHFPGAGHAAETADKWWKIDGPCGDFSRNSVKPEIIAEQAINNGEVTTRLICAIGRADYHPRRQVEAGSDGGSISSDAVIGASVQPKDPPWRRLAPRSG